MLCLTNQYIYRAQVRDAIVDMKKGTKQVKKDARVNTERRTRSFVYTLIDCNRTEFILCLLLLAEYQTN